MISTTASAVSSTPHPTSTHQPHTYNPRNFHELWKVPFTEYKNILECDLGINRIRKAVTSLTALLEVISKGPSGAISRCLSQTIKSTAYAENMYIAYLLSLVACQLNGLDFQCEAEILHRRALCIGIRCIGGNNPRLADSMEWLAFSLYRQGNYKESQLLCMSALVLLQSSLGGMHPDTSNCYSNLIVVLESRSGRQPGDEMKQKGKGMMTAAQPVFASAMDQNKEFMGRTGELISKPTAASYQNNSSYILGAGWRGLSVS